jgi:hypothetical protein
MTELMSYLPITFVILIAYQPSTTRRHGNFAGVHTLYGYYYQVIVQC